MRPLEILICGLAVISLVRLTIFPNRWPRWLDWMPIVALGVIGLHLWLEGYRWQMVPAYGLTLIASGVTWNRARASRSASQRRWVRWLGLGAGGGAVIIALALPVVFPVPQFPPLTGRYRVGTVSYHFVDATRAEIYTADPNDQRELMVQVWYPAQPAPNAQPGPWMNRVDIAASAITTYLHLPPFLLDHLNLVRTRAYPAAPLPATLERYPVVIHSHGWNGFRTLETSQVEELASHGYIVVAIDHTYGSMITVFDDGRVALNNPQALPRGAPPAEYQRASEILEAVYAADIRFTLDRLAELDHGLPDDRLAGRMDLDHIGIYGHSTGGGATVIACAQDARCKAGLTMDAWLEPVPTSTVTQSLSQPFLFMRSEVWATGKDEAPLALLFRGLRSDGYRLTIAGTKHYDFTDLPLLSPLAPAMGLKGPLPGGRVIQVVNAYLVAFFDQYLKGEASALLAGPALDYPEVTFESQLR